MSLLPVFAREFGSGYDYKVHTSKITPAKIAEAKEIVGQVRASRSLYKRVSQNVGEEHVDYIERASMHDPDMRRREDETVDEHATRVMTPKADAVELGILLLNALAPAFGQKEVSRDAYDNVQWHPTRDFIFNILNWMECPANDFAPKSIAGTDNK